MDCGAPHLLLAPALTLESVILDKVEDWVAGHIVDTKKEQKRLADNKDIDDTENVVEGESDNTAAAVAVASIK